MKLLLILNYYYPYVSGVSEYARILAQNMAERGHEVRVLTSNHARLPAEEMIDGVRVTRAPVICKISKGTVSPLFIVWARRMAAAADVVNVHLPMIESGVISSFIPSGKLVTTYHCDIHLQNNIWGKLIVGAMDRSNGLCLKKSAAVVVQTADYASHSRAAARWKEKFVEAGAPVKEYGKVPSAEPSGKKCIGFCGRLVEEKGIGVLLRAYQLIRKKRGDVRLLIGGDYLNVAGGSVYPALQSFVEEQCLEDVRFCGKIPEEEMAAFYSSLDVFVLPSINSLEAFGMVQIEAMLCGTPVVATDLYGVRTIVGRTGMGRVVKRGDPGSLAEGILEVLDHREAYCKPREDILALYGTKVCTDIYEKCFEQRIKNG